MKERLTLHQKTEETDMKHQENITIQSLAQNEDVQIGYSDNDIIVVDSIQKFADFLTSDYTTKQQASRQYGTGTKTEI